MKKNRIREVSPETLDLTELQAFLAVINERSFSRAAAKMNRTQSAISYAVRRLERKIGERLFQRSTNNGSLTAAGEVLREYAERLIQLADEAQVSVRDLREFHQGRIRIGANEARIPLMMPFIRAFRAKYPHILIDVRRTHARNIAAEIVQGNIDFGVTSFALQERSLRTISLGSDELVALVYPSHPFATRSDVSIVDWAREPVISPAPSPARDRVVRLAESRGTPVNFQLNFPTLEAVKLAVIMQLGVTLLPRRSAEAEIKSGTLVAVPVKELRKPQRISLVFRRASDLSYAASAFLHVITDLTRKKSRAN